MVLPQEREFGWELKSPSTTLFSTIVKDNGQICAVLAHSLIRGCTTEMLAWWFKHFPNLEVHLEDVKGYEGQKVPAYYLWHPSDHIGAQLIGDLAPDGTAQKGAFIHIQEAMQAKKYGLKYPVNTKLQIFYVEPDGWAMGLEKEKGLKAMCLRISFRDVYEGDDIIGVHYHYEVIAGVSGNDQKSLMINQQITQSYSEEFWQAWHTHNTIEVGTLENFLPILFAQKHHLGNLHYAKDMNPINLSSSTQSAFSKQLFEERVKGYQASTDPYAYQNAEETSFL